MNYEDKMEEMARMGHDLEAQTVAAKKASFEAYRLANKIDAYCSARNHFLENDARLQSKLKELED